MQDRFLGRASRPLILGFEVDDRFGHIHRSGVDGAFCSPDFSHNAFDERILGNDLVLPAENVGRFGKRNTWVGNGHEEGSFFIEGRHKFGADRSRQPKRGSEDHNRRAQRNDPVLQGPAQYWFVNQTQGTHHGIGVFTVQLAPNQEGAKHRHQGHCDQGGARHGEGLGEGQRVKHLAFHAGECEHRDEGKNNDGHRKEDRPADQFGRFQGDLANR